MSRTPRHFVAVPDCHDVSRMVPALQLGDGDLKSVGVQMVEQGERAIRRTKTSLADSLHAFSPAEHDRWSEAAIQLSMYLERIKTSTPVGEGNYPGLPAEDKTMYVSVEQYSGDLQGAKHSYGELQSLMVRLEKLYSL